MRYFFIVLFTLLSCLGCNTKLDVGSQTSASGGSSSGGSGGSTLPKVEGVTTLQNGAASIPAYSGDSLYTLFYYIPDNPASSAISNYTVRTQGVSNRLEQSSKENEIVEAEISFHEEQRLLEQEMLASKIPQAKSNSSALLKSGNFNLGDKWTGVYMSRNINGIYSSINATCVAVSQRAYFFLEDGIGNIAPNLLNEFANGFDTLYPIMGEKFGHENDVDNNGKVIILFYNAQKQGLFGYFTAQDKYPTSTYQSSNVADMFYVNYNMVSEQYKYDILGTLAHEFQHMILYDSRYNDGNSILENWINEGLSMEAEYLTGYYEKSTTNFLETFGMLHSKLSLTQWTSLNYGYSMVYLRYLREQFGDGIIGKLYKTPYTSTDAVAEATGRKFSDLFNDFALAVLLSGRGITDDSKYNFKTIERIALSYTNANLGVAVSGSITPYSIQLTRWNGVVSSVNASGVVGYASSLVK